MSAAPSAASGSKVQQVTPRAQELLDNFSVEVYREAYEKGVSLSAHLEKLDPSAAYNDGLDAFSRLLMLAGIRTRSSEAHGLYADTYRAFEKNQGTRALFHEWAARQWRRAATGHDVSTRALYQSNDQPVGTVANPLAMADTARYRQLAPAIPISELVAITTPIDSGAYQAFYLEDNTDELRMKRVLEGTDIPSAKLSGGNATIHLRKYGRLLDVTYEQMRRMKLDLIALHIERMAVQAQADKLKAIINVLVNGDGNANTAAVSYALTDLDPNATAGTLSLRGWQRFKKKFKNPYLLTTALMQEDIATDLELLSLAGTNIMLVQLTGEFGELRRINQQPGQVGYGWTEDAPADKIVGLDSRLGIERVTEIGSALSEIDKSIRNQTESLAMSEVEGYVKFDRDATLVLDISS